MSPRLFGAFTPVHAYTNTLEFSLSHTYTLSLCVSYTLTHTHTGQAFAERLLETPDLGQCILKRGAV